MKYKTKKLAGFSLLEMIIAMSIFSLIVMATVAAFASIVSTQKKTKEIQKNLESTRTALELVGKTMRFSNHLSSGGESVIFLYNTSQNKCLSYQFSENGLEEAKFGPPSDPSDCENAENYIGIYKTLVAGATGKFNVIETNKEAAAGDFVIGKATISINIGGNYLQTSASFRDYEDILGGSSTPPVCDDDTICNAAEGENCSNCADCDCGGTEVCNATSETCESVLSDCELAGGTDADCGGTPCCKFGASSCPSGWTQYLSWSVCATTVVTTCNIAGTGCPLSFCQTTLPGHGWANQGCAGLPPWPGTPYCLQAGGGSVGGCGAGDSCCCLSCCASGSATRTAIGCEKN